MKNFDDYKIADLDSDFQYRFSVLEKKISQETNKNVVLIAYEEK